MPKVTVALITYNRANLLKRAIEGILSQTFKDFELIIMDNGSTDNTYYIVKMYDDPRITYHRNEINSREYGNLAFAMGSGDYLLITHDDDIADRELLEQEVKIMDLYQEVVVVASNVRIIDLSGNLLKKRSMKLNSDLILGQYDFIKCYFCDGIYIPMPTALMRREFFLQNKLKFDTCVGPAADTFLWFNVNTYPVYLYIIKNTLYSYSIHSLQDSVLNTEEILLQFYNAVKPFLKKVNLSYLQPMVDNYIAKALLSHTLKLKVSGLITDEKYKEKLDTIESLINNWHDKLLYIFFLNCKLSFKLGWLLLNSYKKFKSIFMY